MAEEFSGRLLESGRAMPSHASTVAPALDQPLLTVNEAAAMLSVSRSRIYAFVRAGELNPYRVGTRLRFAHEDLRELVRPSDEEVAR
jgi:excisionase family DNA binding protein